MADNFKLGNNGKEINYEQFMAKIQSGEIEQTNNKFWQYIIRVYDEDGNGKIDTTNNEMKNVWQAFKNAAGEDSILSTEETAQMLKANNVDKTEAIDIIYEIKKVFGNVNAEITIPTAHSIMERMTDEQAQNEIVNTIMDDVNSAYTLYQQQDNGSITKGYDWLKNYFNSELSSSNVEEALALQACGAENLLLAKDGRISKKEYYLQNKDHLKQMFIRRLYVKDENTGLDFLDRNKGNKTKEQFAKILEDWIQDMIDNIQDMGELKRMQGMLVKLNEEQTEDMLNHAVEAAKMQSAKAPTNVPSDSIGFVSLDLKKPTVPIEFATNEPISFEEVFRYERGCEYSKENVEFFIKTKNEMDFATGAYNKYQQFKSVADEFLKDYSNATSGHVTPSGMYIASPEPNASQQAQKIVNLYNLYYENPINPNLAKEQLTQLIEQSQLKIKVLSDNNGNISLDLSAYSSDSEKNRALNSLMRLGLELQKEHLNKLLDGDADNKLASLSQNMEWSHDAAFGKESSEELVQAMENDNKTVITRYTGGAAMTGMALTVVGGVLCFTPLAPLGGAMVTAGNYVAIGGMVAESALGYTEALTRDEVSSEELEDLTKTMIMNAGGFIIGFRAGKTGMKAFNKLIDKKLAEVFKQEMANVNRTQALKKVFTNPEYLKNFMTAAGAKISTDFLISYAGDLAMMGVLDTNDDWQSLLKANLMGIVVGSSGDVADVGKLGMKGARYKELEAKTLNGIITPKERMELKNLKEILTQQGIDINAIDVCYSDAYPKPNIVQRAVNAVENFVKYDIKGGFNIKNICKNKAGRVDENVVNIVSQFVDKARELGKKDIDIRLIISAAKDNEGNISIETMKLISQLLEYDKKNQMTWLLNTSRDGTIDKVIENNALEFALELAPWNDFQDVCTLMGAFTTARGTEEFSIKAMNLIRDLMHKDLINDTGINFDDICLINDILRPCRDPEKGFYIDELLDFAKELVDNGSDVKNLESIIIACKDENNNISSEHKQLFKELKSHGFRENYAAELMNKFLKSDDSKQNQEVKSYILELRTKGINDNNISLILNSCLIHKGTPWQSLDSDWSEVKYVVEKLLISFNDKKFNNENINQSFEKIFNIANYLKDFDNNSLALSEKIELYEKLINADEETKATMRDLGIDLNEIATHIGTMIGAKRDNITTPKKQQQKFVEEIIANNNLKSENVLKTFDFAQYEKNGLPLKYSRDEFNSKIEAILKDLTDSERDEILVHFGLSKGANGYEGLPNNKSIDAGKFSKNTEKAARKVLEEIEKFTLKNEVKTGDSEVDKVLNGLIQGLPEFTSIVGKEQHGTHAYSVDIHMLKVLQSAINNPLYSTLSDKDKTILKISILLHDLGKKGGVVDNGHAELSADYVNSILDKFPFPRDMKDRILDIVDNHHWFEAYNKGNADAKDVAIRCRRPEDFKIYQIFAKADFENVNKDFHLDISNCKSQEEFDVFMQNKMENVADALNYIYSKANLVFDTQFVRNGELFPTKTVEIDGESTELKVLNLNEIADIVSLQEYGFAPGVTKENARFMVHMTEPNKGKMGSVLILTGNSLNESAWSTSMIKVSDNRTYVDRKFGFILDIDQANISEAYYENTGSGYEKGLNDFKKILFNANNEARTYVKDNLIKELQKKKINLSDEEYSELTRILINKKYTTQIKEDITIGNKTIKASDLVECLEKARDALFEGDDIHSEIVALNPRVKGLIAKVEKIEDCPEAFLKFAKEHNLPIILMRPTKKGGNVE